jgi:hypothetical protein
MPAQLSQQQTHHHSNFTATTHTPQLHSLLLHTNCILLPPAPAAANAACIQNLTLGSTPDAHTLLPSGLAASASTSAANCWWRLSSVPKPPSQNCTAPSPSPLTIVPFGSTARDHTQGGAPLLVPTVMRCSSVPAGKHTMQQRQQQQDAAKCCAGGCQCKEHQAVHYRLLLVVSQYVW